ncbi:hypothetical protein F5X99DRAFT_399347 [Biscogniauxia marginata]|nr:hypothetical protein F5X99DRAFT_399347 [Biscogniauxia marginata]
MSSCQRVARPLAQSLRQERLLQNSTRLRAFSTSAPRQDESSTTTSATPPPPSSPPPAASTTPADQAQAASDASKKQRMQERLLDRETTTAHWAERKLLRMGTPPVGSRRRRAALRTSQNLPFEQLPYQCFQEARRLLQEDRAEKLRAIAKELAKVRRLEDTPADQLPGGERRKNRRLESLRKYVEELKILADINDPVVKRKFEDGFGTCNIWLSFLFVVLAPVFKINEIPPISDNCRSPADYS